MSIMKGEQFARLSPYFVTPEPGEERPNPATLGNPSQYNGLGLAVALLQRGADPINDVWRLLTREQQRAIAEIAPGSSQRVLPEITFVEFPAPPLPKSAQLPLDAAKGASPWLDEYVGFSRKWSPRAFDGFHEACGLWLLSTIAARRATLHMGGPRYTNLYFALAARTSLWAKSTTAKIAIGTLRDAGFHWLLASDDATPQKFISDLTRKVPGNYGDLDAEAKKRALLRIGFSAQRGWFYEEFGQKIQAMMNAAGFMADFRGILRSLDDCPEHYEYGTIGRGTDVVERPYLALLGNLTPADLREAARKNEALWNDGFWARFAFITPPMGANSSRARFPEGERITPPSLLTPLREWHERLGEPDVELEDKLDDKGNPSGGKFARVFPHATPPCVLGNGVKDAYYAYGDALLDMVENGGCEDLDGNYARFPEKAMRIATLLASLQGSETVEMRHWARGQEITERWRGGLHSLYDQVNQLGSSEQAQREDRIVEIVSKLKDPTPTDVQRFMPSLSIQEIINLLDGLVDAGALVRGKQTRKGTSRYLLAENESGHDE